MEQKGLMIFADGFEDVEGIATYDVLHRAGIDVTRVGFDNKNVLTAHGNLITFEKRLADVDYQNFDFLIIPGGPAVFRVLDNSKLIEEIITHFVNKNSLVATICAAPLLVGKLGFLKNKKYTCFPGCDVKIIGGIKEDVPIVCDGNFITARSMYYSCDFGLEIVRFLNPSKYETIKNSIKGVE